MNVACVTFAGLGTQYPVLSTQYSTVHGKRCSGGALLSVPESAVSHAHPVTPSPTMPRILSISGLRGVIGDGLDPGYIADFAAAVGTWAKGGTVVLGRDGRSTGTMVRQAVLAGLTATGCRVLDADIAATPSLGVLVDHHQAAAGIQITASHNPIEWNGLKPFGPTGAVFNAEQGRELVAIMESRAFGYKSWDGLGSIETLNDPHQPHLDRVLPLVDVERIRNAGLKVVLDCCHGAGSAMGPTMLEQLGCESHILGATPDGEFEHPPEPLAENLTQLCEAVTGHNAAVGFAQDPDADRLAIVDEQGRYIGEELTLALCVDHVLGSANRSQNSETRHQSPITSHPTVVINASTSRVTIDIAERHGCVAVRSNVGEANVVAKMRELNAVIGGEGNGGVIEPNVGWVRDSFVSMAYILDGLAQRGGTLSNWVDTLPKYAIVKNKITCSRETVPAAVDALKSAFPDAESNESDGLRLDWPDRWVQVRGSNTEPIVRIIAEAPEQSTAISLCEQAKTIVAQAAGVE